MSEHARLSPSNQRWPHCPGSVREEAPYPDTPGRAAVDGTGTHLLLEKCLLSQCRADSYLHATIGVDHADQPLGWVVDADRAERAQMGLDYVDRRVRELKEAYPEADIHVEAETKSRPGERFSPPRDDWWGTVDIKITVTENHVTRFIEVVDYKDGRGFVPAKNNTQLQSYAAGKMPVGAFRMSQVDAVRATIVQPKTTPVVRYHEYSPQEIHEAAVTLKEAADKTDDPTAGLWAGWWCQWCKANPKNGGHCTQAAKQSTQEVQAMTDTETGLEGLLELDVNEASEAQLAKIMDQKPTIDAAFQRVEEEIESRLNQELDVPGWAMKPGRKTRDWADEQEVMEALKTTSLKVDEYAPRKLVSPAQAEKVVSKRTMEGKLRDLIVEKPGNLKPRRVSQDQKQDNEDVFGASPQKSISFK